MKQILKSSEEELKVFTVKRQDIIKELKRRVVVEMEYYDQFMHTNPTQSRFHLGIVRGYSEAIQMLSG